MIFLLIIFVFVPQAGDTSSYHPIVTFPNGYQIYYEGLFQSLHVFFRLVMMIALTLILTYQNKEVDMTPVKRNQEWLPSFFNDFFDNNWMMKANSTAPAINVIENEKDYKVELAAPGMVKDDFKITLNPDNELVIEMEKKSETKEEDKEKKKYLRREFSYSKFQQAILLPDNVEKDKISAKMENGILFIEIPKTGKEPVEQAAKAIEVK